MHAISDSLPRELTLLERDLGLGRSELVLRGPLPLGWCERLSAHFVARGASIERLVGASSPAGHWEVEIAWLGGRRIDVWRGLAELEPIDRRLHELHMDDGRVWPERDGSLGLEVMGRDRRGLLAALLRRLGMHGLFPIRLDVQTHGERVHDRFVLRGFSGSTPSPERAERLLHELLHPRRGGPPG